MKFNPINQPERAQNQSINIKVSIKEPFRAIKCKVFTVGFLMCVIHNFHTWCENLLSRLEALHMYLLLMVYIHEEVKRIWMSYVSLILDVLTFYMDFFIPN